MTSKHLPELGAAELVLQTADAQGRSIKDLRNRLLVYMLHSTGARISELLALKWGEVDWDQKRVWIESLKHGEPHWVFFHDECIATMRKFQAVREIEGHTALIPSTNHGHDSLTRERAHVIVTELAKRAGVRNFGPHSFRHNLGIRTVRATGNIRMAQMLLGHKSIQTTAQYYSTLLPEDLAAGHSTVFSLDPHSPAQIFAGSIWNHGD